MAPPCQVSKCQRINPGAGKREAKEPLVVLAWLNMDTTRD
jgi:hypothetical protein